MYDVQELKDFGTNLQGHDEIVLSTKGNIYNLK